METMTQEEAIMRFSQIMAPYMHSTAVDPRAVIETMISFYKKIKIRGTELEAGSDMLLLEWGNTTVFLTKEFADYRMLTDDDLRAIPQQECRYISLSRQVYYPGQGDEDPEAEDFVDDPGFDFDDFAIQISVYLIFGPVDKGQKSANMWVENPDELPDKLEEFFAVDFVKEMLDLHPSHVNSSVGLIG